MLRNFFKLGDTISGTLFFDPPGKIHQTSVSLEQIEVLNVDNCEKVTKKSLETRSKTVAEMFEYSLNTIQTQFSLYIPLEYAPEFKTNLVEVRWEISFQFLVEKEDCEVSGNNIPIDIVNWSIPVHIVVFDFPSVFLNPHNLTYFLE